MSTPVPIQAPWLSEWTRYPVQIYPMPVSGRQAGIEIPAGQWWRIVWTQFQPQVSAAAGTRGVILLLSTFQGQAITIAAPAPLTASQAGFFSAFPGATGYFVTTASAEKFAVLAVPDMIWPPGSAFTWALRDPLAGDSVTASNCQVAVEIYVESYNEQQQPVLVPAPTLA